MIERLAFTMVIAARKLRPYFHTHTIIVLTNHPLKQVVIRFQAPRSALYTLRFTLTNHVTPTQVLQRPMASGRLIKWAIKLSKFNIHYQLCKAIKAQALADFIVENIATPKVDSNNLGDVPHQWQLWTDGSSAHGTAGAGCVILPPIGNPITYSLVLSFSATNNQADYEALITELLITRGTGAKSIDIFYD